MTFILYKKTTKKNILLLIHPLTSRQTTFSIRYSVIMSRQFICNWRELTVLDDKSRNAIIIFLFSC